MNLKTIFLLFAISILSTGCGVDIASEGTLTATPDFTTATLQPSPIPQATHTLMPPTPIPSVAPIEGTTTTQVNVRVETSTASANLGVINQFTKIQVIGKDASGSWYRIVYAESTTGYGWVRAEYVQVNAPAEIPLVEASAGGGLGVSGLVIQKINIRNGPGTTYQSLGVLNPNDVVFITGKDPSGAWMQIEFTSAPDGKGWAASEFLQVTNAESLAVIGAVSPTDIAATPAITILVAMEDGDSMQAPSVTANLSASGVRVLQFNGEVSSPTGDIEDWVGFISSSKNILAELKCSNAASQAELWNNSGQVNFTPLVCGEKRAIKIEINQSYFFHVLANNSDIFQYIQYSLKVSVVE